MNIKTLELIHELLKEAVKQRENATQILRNSKNDAYNEALKFDEDTEEYSSAMKRCEYLEDLYHKSANAEYDANKALEDFEEYDFS